MSVAVACTLNQTHAKLHFSGRVGFGSGTGRFRCLYFGIILKVLSAGPTTQDKTNGSVLLDSRIGPAFKQWGPRLLVGWQAAYAPQFLEV